MHTYEIPLDQLRPTNPSRSMNEYGGLIQKNNASHSKSSSLIVMYQWKMEKNDQICLFDVAVRTCLIMETVVDLGRLSVACKWSQVNKFS